MEFLGVNLPQMTVLIHESVSHTACVAVPNACSPLKILALKGRGRRRERLPPSSSNTCTRTGTIDQASKRARRKRARGRPATDLFSNSQSVLRTPPPPKKKESGKKGRRGNSFEGEGRAVTNERAKGRTRQRFLQAQCS